MKSERYLRNWSKGFLISRTLGRSLADFTFDSVIWMQPPKPGNAALKSIRNMRMPTTAWRKQPPSKETTRARSSYIDGRWRSNRTPLTRRSTSPAL